MHIIGFVNGLPTKLEQNGIFNSATYRAANQYQDPFSGKLGGVYEN